jgi:uncharacterized protein YegP (UPF0339 family)
MATEQLVDYVKLRQEDDGWWYDEYAGNNEVVGNSDEGYASKSHAIHAIQRKHGVMMRIVSPTNGDITVP